MTIESYRGAKPPSDPLYQSLINPRSISAQVREAQRIGRTRSALLVAQFTRTYTRVNIMEPVYFYLLGVPRRTGVHPGALCIHRRAHIGRVSHRSRGSRNNPDVSTRRFNNSRRRFSRLVCACPPFSRQIERLGHRETYKVHFPRKSSSRHGPFNSTHRRIIAPFRNRESNVLSVALLLSGERAFQIYDVFVLRVTE